MRLASINLNRRLRNETARVQFLEWLRARSIDIVLAQEPWSNAGHAPPALPGFTFLGGNALLAAWLVEGPHRSTASSPEPWVQRIEVEWMVLFQVHLDANSARMRAAQLVSLRTIVAAERGRPALVCGDFNIAPRLCDGLFGDQCSTFNSRVDRSPLQELMTTADLVDATLTDPPAFTFERTINARLSQFRCDLALVSRHLGSSVSIEYDHSVRLGAGAFTDHSAVVANLPITPGAVANASSNTAMGRKGPSLAARLVTEQLVAQLGDVRSVLDHGCGHGRDVAHYRRFGLFADGYDPNIAFHYPRPLKNDYDLVTSVFVLNVLSDPWERIQALRDACSYLRPGGYLLVVTRSPKEIAAKALKGDWVRYQDGYWSSLARCTFQRGISGQEVLALGRQVGMRVENLVRPLPHISDACIALLTNAEPGTETSELPAWTGTAAPSDQASVMEMASVWRPAAPPDPTPEPGARLFAAADWIKTTDTPSMPASLVWLDPSASPFGIRVLDVRPFTWTVASTTADPRIAARFASLRAADAGNLAVAHPQNSVTVPCALDYPPDSMTKRAPLFLASVMEDKWDVILESGRIYVLRSWTGDLRYVATLQPTAAPHEALHVSEIDVADGDAADFDLDQAISDFDFVIKAYVLGQLTPHTIPRSLSASDEELAVYSFSVHGRRATFAAMPPGQ